MFFYIHMFLVLRVMGEFYIGCCFFSILSMKFIYLFSFADMSEYSILDYFGW